MVSSGNIDELLRGKEPNAGQVSHEGGGDISRVEDAIGARRKATFVFRLIDKIGQGTAFGGQEGRANPRAALRANLEPLPIVPTLVPRLEPPAAAAGWRAGRDQAA